MLEFALGELHAPCGKNAEKLETCTTRQRSDGHLHGESSQSEVDGVLLPGLEHLKHQGACQPTHPLADSAPGAGLGISIKPMLARYLINKVTIEDAQDLDPRAGDGADA